MSLTDSMRSFYIFIYVTILLWGWVKLILYVMILEFS